MVELVKTSMQGDKTIFETGAHKLPQEVIYEKNIIEKEYGQTDLQHQTDLRPEAPLQNGIILKHEIDKAFVKYINQLLRALIKENNETEKKCIQTNKHETELHCKIKQYIEIIKIVSGCISSHDDKRFIIIALFYNASNGSQDQFIKLFRDPPDSKNNQTIRDGFEVIKKLCGAKFDITKIESLINSEDKFNIDLELSSAQHYHNRLLYQNLDSYTSKHICKRIPELFVYGNSTILDLFAKSRGIKNPDITFKGFVIQYIESLLRPPLQYQDSNEWTHFTSNNNKRPDTPRF